MTTEEKLEHFQSFCIQDVKKKGEKVFTDFTAELEHQMEEHKNDALRHADMEIQSESEKITHEINKKLALEQLKERRIFSQKQQELKEKLFVEVQNALDNYLSSPQYEQLLLQLIRQAKEFAGDNELIIYIDPMDADKINRLSIHLNISLTLSEYSFGGGIRAVIPSKNILIDHSFSSKLEEAKRSFQFHIKPGGTLND